MVSYNCNLLNNGHLEIVNETGKGFEFSWVPVNKNKIVNFMKYKKYKGETVCGICLTDMVYKEKEISGKSEIDFTLLSRCDTCKKCVHKNCNSKWNRKCVYCRN